MIQNRIYKPKGNVNPRDLMVKKIGPQKEGCMYIGQIVRGSTKYECYMCFFAVALVDSEISIIGIGNNIIESHKKLESLLDTELIEI